MAGESVKRLRKAYSEYLNAKQARYNEIAEMYGITVGCDLYHHNQIMKTLEGEESGQSELISVKYDQ